LRRVKARPRVLPYMDFEARVRYLASSLIVTIPARVVRALGLRLGDRVVVRVKTAEAAAITALMRFPLIR